jgi:hypothetical protein
MGSRGGAGQEERRQGSPRRSCDGGAVGSGRRGGVPMGGWLWWGGGVLGMVLQLAAKAGKVVTGVASEQDEKYGAGGIRSAVGGSALLKGAGETRAEGGLGCRVTRGVERGRERGGPSAEGGLGHRASAGPGGQRRDKGVSASERVGAALTSGAGSTVRPIRFSNRINFISNGFKFAPNFD